MELRQLQYLVAVVEEGGFTRAAERLHLAQPGVSAQIRQLERELGQQLLDRSGRSVTPTEVGAAVLPYARAALAAVEGVRQTAEGYAGLLRGQVAVGMVAGAAGTGPGSGSAAGEFDLAGVLADFHAEHPGVDISLTESTSERMIAALRRGELDLAVVGLAGTDPPAGVEIHLVVDVPLVAALAPADPLAADPGPLPVAALADRPLIGLPPGTGLRGALERACAEAGVRPRVAFEASAPPLLARLAARGLGVAVLPELTPDAATVLGVRTRRLVAPEPRGRVALAWPTMGPARPAARALLARLRTAFGLR
ncbi:LysR substrate-binding domain-containing protein [Kitasatospora sp. NPDC093806]|uniref:LysR family transcriptional regulator n=1 Tax=Kitasatospora sp. NPDC093806 TaxID=3155075 RepID=UPI003443C4B3